MADVVVKWFPKCYNSSSKEDCAKKSECTMAQCRWKLVQPTKIS